ncbi:GNAT family N-acetyltransferase [Sphingobacterium faecale]|uniref:N-acetyltransferase n=1 Tax=Sphingobacterium faecale TaxID=2803775 RepID=A0ABS1R371_9SPHI|nr:GNAT family N-acetyltransferase [Sphingobacterium faecale]MBL1409142.1 N-acetyltransferase [Sphingobacterium faecale]
MKEELHHIPLVKNDLDHRFEINVNGYLAFIDFKETRSRISLIHTEAAAELKGTGAAQAVVEKTLLFIEQDGRKLMPYCPYVFAYVKKHPEWKRIVDPAFPAYGDI